MLSVPSMPTASPESVVSPIVAITPGDLAGIGPEIIVRTLCEITHTRHDLPYQPIPLLLGPASVYQQAADLFGLPAQFEPLNVLPTTKPDLQSLLSDQFPRNRWVCWNPTRSAAADIPRRTVSASSGDAAFQCLIAAIQLTRDHLCDAICTAPLNKESLHLAGHHFPGHTEILAEQCGVQEFAMMLYLPPARLLPLRQLIQQNSAHPSSVEDGSGLSIAHVTLHTSVASVPGLLSIGAIEEKIRLLDGFLGSIGCSRRAVGVAALNPHGGENGLFGDEESRLIQPAVARSVAAGCHAFGPLPVDTLIRRAVLGEFDGVVAMYHDQGHIPIKLIGFDAAVNITLGLPIIRTSPTHGTAFDRAWNSASPSDHAGMLEALLMACRLAASPMKPTT